MTRADDLAAWTAANKRAASAYHGDLYGCCNRGKQYGHAEDCPVKKRRPAHRLIRAAELDHRHHGHHIKVDGLEGEYVGIVPLPGGQRVVIALIVGGARAWKDVAVGEFVEVWRAAT